MRGSMAGSIEPGAGARIRGGDVDRERVREASPIDTVVGEYFPLIPDGRGFKLLCPFHREKTPSFKVDPERGTYRCYGCNEGGDVFSFVMKMENLEFPGALRHLAERAVGFESFQYRIEWDSNPQGRKLPFLPRVFQTRATNR